MKIIKQYKVGTHEIAYVEEPENDITSNFKYYFIKDNTFIPISHSLYAMCAMVHNLDMQIEKDIERINKYKKQLAPEEIAVADELINILNSTVGFSKKVSLKH